MDAVHYLTETGNLRSLNRHLALDIIRFTPGGISRADLSRKLGISRAAVSLIVNDFLQAGLIREMQNGPTAVGRRPVLLEINPTRGRVVGIDMGSSHLSLLLTDLAANVLHESEAPFDITAGPKDSLEQLCRAMETFLAEAGFSLEDILAFGIGVPGPISAAGDTVIAPPIMPGWDRYPIRDELEDLWSRPVSLNNDAELGALGEWAYGAGREEKNLVYIKVGSGIGAGLMIDNRVYRGETGAAGEIGHLTVRENGPLCTCGNHGCLELFSGGRAIAHRGRLAAGKEIHTQLSSLANREGITARDVAEAARRGDLVAQQIIFEAGVHLGTILAGLINLLNPGIVVVGGGVAQTGDLLLEPIRMSVRERSLQAAVEAVRITTATLGRRSTGMGAVVQALTIVLHKLTENEEEHDKLARKEVGS